MSKITLDTTDMEAIGAAIRTKLDVETTYKAGEMPAAILSIPSGGITPTGTISIDSNGLYDVTQYASANVQVSGGGGDPALPPEYQEVKWIGFDGNQYMLVDNLPDDYLIQLLARNTTITAEACVVGYRVAESSNDRDFEIEYASGSLKLWVRSGTYGWEVAPSYPSGSDTQTTREIFVLLVGQSRKNFYIGTYYAGSSYVFYGRVYAIKLFSFSRTSGSFTDVSPIRKFVPCYRKSDGEIGLYELYTGTFYTNEGTGVFTKGADVT